MVQTPINQQENVTIWSVSLCVSKAAVLQPQKLQIFFLALIPQFFPNLLWSDRLFWCPYFRVPKKVPLKSPKSPKSMATQVVLVPLFHEGVSKKSPKSPKRVKLAPVKVANQVGFFVCSDGPHLDTIVEPSTLMPIFFFFLFLKISANNH